jgi:methionine synthase II (cobalamin-independent)
MLTTYAVAVNSVLGNGKEHIVLDQEISMTKTIHPVLLVGSVPLACSRDVFDAVGEHLGPLAACVPDGETGERLSWVSWLRSYVATLDGIELLPETELGGSKSRSIMCLRLREGFRAHDLKLRPLGYTKHAVASYADFKASRAAGKIPEGTRFQVSIPSPLIMACTVRGPNEEILSAFEQAVIEEIAEIAEHIPHEDLAIQLDVVEPLAEEFRLRPEAGKPMLNDMNLWFTSDQATDSAARVCNTLPADAQVGIHLCYGDPGGSHLIEPLDASVLRDFANALSEKITRPLNWIHMPIPIERDDDAYFAPLAGLRLQPQTQLYLGLVHQEDGVDGARGRMNAARRYVSSFGVATECGLGRLPKEIIPDLLDLHREVAELA